MKDWALILGCSSGFGASACKELASNGINIFGIHLDRKATMGTVNLLIEELKSKNVKVKFRNVSATNAIKRKEIIEELKSYENVRIKVLMHSLAFGALKPIIDYEIDNILMQKQIEMTQDVMSNSLVYWSQDLFKVGLLKKGSQIFAMTSSGGHKQWKSYGAVSAAKASIESFCRQLAFEFSEFGIAVNAIQAGVTDTPALRKIPDNKLMIDRAKKINPGKRITTPEDVSYIIKMIGLSEHSWMTGNIIKVDGGEDITG